MTLKVIEGLEPWEVMKAHKEGKRLAYCFVKSDVWLEAVTPKWNWGERNYAIIDESQPEIDWEGFDWEFFNQYGGLMVCTADKDDQLPMYAHIKKPDVDEWLSYRHVAESPFYPWFGGECPVPANVEVKMRLVFEDHIGGIADITYTDKAENFTWSNKEYVAFRLTGRVCDE